MRVEYTFHENGNFDEMVTINQRTNQREGLFRKWYEDGTLKHECTYKNGKMHGVEKGWYPSSELSFECTHEHGKMHGPNKVWYISNKLCLQENYFEGKLHGKQLMWGGCSGKLVSSIQYFLGERNGPYYERGEYVGHYVDNEKDGVWYEDGEFRFYKYGEVLTTNKHQVDVQINDGDVKTFTFGTFRLTEVWFKDTILLKRYWTGTGKREKWSMNGRLLRSVYVYFDDTESHLLRGGVYEYFESGQLSHYYHFSTQMKVGVEQYYSTSSELMLSIDNDALPMCRFKEIKNELSNCLQVRSTYSIGDCGKKHGWERVWDRCGSHKSQSYYICGDKVYEQLF